MESGKRCRLSTQYNTTICPCDQCGKDGGSFRALKNVEFAGFVFDESNDDYIDMITESAMVSPGLKRPRSPNMIMEREFEFDISGIDNQASKELDSIVSPADELFYKGQLLPLDLHLRIQMVQKFEKLLSSETKPSGNCSGDRDEFGFPTPDKSCDVTFSNVAGKETCSNGSATAFVRNQSTRSQQAAVANKLKASKAYIKSLLSKASITRATDTHHSQNSIRREIYDDENAAALVRRTRRENSYSIHRKSSARFSYLKETPLISKPYSKPLGSSNRIDGGPCLRRSISSVKESSSPLTSKFNNSKPFNSSNPRASPARSGVLLKRSMSSASRDMENGIQAAIAHCKQSHAADPKNMIDTSRYLQRQTSNPEGYPADHLEGRPVFGSRIATCDHAVKIGLDKTVFMR